MIRYRRARSTTFPVSVRAAEVLSSLWESLGGEAVRAWSARLFTSAALFWLAGSAAVWLQHNAGRVRDAGWIGAVSPTAASLRGVPPVVTAAAVIVGLLVVGASALAAERLTLPVLRLLEGYWRRPAWVRARLVRRRRAARDRAMGTYQALQRARANGTRPDAADELRLARAMRTLRSTPAAPQLTMPTRFGNVLRVAETRPLRKHGVDAVACWPHLWLVLPTDSRTEIVSARQAVDGAARVWLWSVLFVAWTPWVWWAPAVAIVAGVAAYANCLRAAGTYAVLVEAAFDVHLPLLYAAVRLSPPASAADAVTAGDRLSRYLRDGSDDPRLVFGAPEGEPRHDPQPIPAGSRPAGTAVPDRP
jgi:hypothetical protein